jgi:hypothetical protein
LTGAPAIGFDWRKNWADPAPGAMTAHPRTTPAAKRNTLIETLPKPVPACLFGNPKGLRAATQMLFNHFVAFAPGHIPDLFTTRGPATKKGPPGHPDGPFRSGPRTRDYIALVVVVIVLVVMVFDIMASFDMVMSFDIIMSFDIMPVFDAPSTAVMLSDIVSMPSVAFRSVTIVFSVAVSLLPPQAETISAAPAIMEPVKTFEMSARIGKLLEYEGFGQLLGGP